MWMNFRHRGRRYFQTIYSERQRQEEELWEEEGAQERKNILYQLDRLMDYSGLRLRLPFACAEFFLLIGAFLMMIGMVPVLVWNWDVIWGLCLGTGLFLLWFIALRMAADRRYNVIESGLFSFVNAVSTESKSADDLITILMASVHSICKPLQIVVEQCCLEARNTGKISLALHHLEISVENDAFRKIIRNLSMCYRTDADYVTVIDQCRVGLKEHIASREERKAVISTGRIEVIQLVGLGGITLYVIGKIIGEGNVFTFMYEFMLGRIVLIYLLLVMAWCVLDALLLNGRN